MRPALLLNYCFTLWISIISATEIHASAKPPGVSDAHRVNAASTLYFNFGYSAVAPSPWNNALQNPSEGAVFPNLKDNTGKSTGVNITLLTPWGGGFNEGATTGNNSGIVPDKVLQEYYWLGVGGAPNTAQFKVSGLSPENQYTFKFVGSSVFRGYGVTDNGSTAYTIGGQTVTLDVEGNTSKQATIGLVSPDASGEVIVEVGKAAGAPVGYINALVIEVVDGNLPYTPVLQSVSYVSGTQVNLSWQDNSSNETGFQVYRSDDPTGTFTQQGTAGANVTSYADNTAQPGSVYFYRVKAITANGSSGYSQAIGVRVPDLGNTNPTPLLFSIKVNFNKRHSATFPWNNSLIHPSNSLRLATLTNDLGQTTDIGLSGFSGWNGVYAAGATTGNNSGVVPDNVLKEYYWFGFDGPDQKAQLKVTGLTPDNIYDFTFVGSSVFRNADVTDNGETIYRVGGSVVSLDVEGNTTQSVTIKDVVPDENGDALIELSKGSSAEVGYINALIVDVYDDGIPSVPANFAATYSAGTQVKLSWQDNSIAETGFEIYRASRPGGPYTLLNSPANNKNQTSYTDNSIAVNKVYFYKVRAVNTNSGSESAYSQVQLVETSSNPTAPAFDHQVHFNFHYDLSNAAAPPWNNANKQPLEGDKFEGLLDEQGEVTGISLELLTGWGGGYDAGAVTGDDSGIVPDKVLKQYYWFGIFGAPETTAIKVSGLSPDNLYNFEFIGSSTFSNSGITDNGSTNYTINETTVSLHVHHNTRNSATIRNVMSNNDGELTIHIAKAANAPVGYINALIIKAHDYDLPATPVLANANYSESDQSIALNWQDRSDNETGFELYKASALEGPYTLVASLNANIATYNDDDILPDKNYFYKMRARSSSGFSGFSTTIRASTVPPKPGIAQIVYLNFCKEHTSPFPWNNWATTTKPSANMSFTRILDDRGGDSGLGMVLLNNWGGVFNKGAVTGDNSGIVPDNVLKEYFWFGVFNAPEVVNMKVYGLIPGRKYNFQFVGSSVFNQSGITDNGSTEYRIGSKKVALDVQNNTENAVTISDVIPDNTGEVFIEITKQAGSPVGYLNAMIVELKEGKAETDNNEYWAMADGDWHGAIWSTSQNATGGSGTTLGINSIVHVNGKTVTVRGQAMSSDLYVTDANSKAGKVIVNAGSLRVNGQVDIQKTQVNGSKVQMLNQGKLKVTDQPLRILPLGNSITHGTNTTKSYRYNLWKKLVASKIDVDFVGSNFTNKDGNPSFLTYFGEEFDTDNEGHWGWRADELVAGLPGWLAQYDADIALVHVGTNDVMQKQSTQSTVTEIKQIIDLLRGDNPKIIILLAQVIPVGNSDVTPLNAAIPSIVQEKNTAQSPVILVDQYTNFDANSDTYDKIHPNESGEEKMAARWFNAILSIFKGAPSL